MPFHSSHHPELPAQQRAFALILVLITLTLAVVIVIFYLSTIGRERNAVDMYTQQSKVRQLSDLPVSIVQGQINAATREGILRYPVSWASQPGMIRTYSDDGNLSNAYKLYSWDHLVQGRLDFDPNKVGTQLPPKTWESSPAIFTDLNQPVNGVYPIADPTSANFGTGTSYTGANVTWDFDEEFSVNTGANSYAAAGGKDVVPGSQAVPNQLPMPVKWIYVLQDGSWAAPDDYGGNDVSFSGLTLNPANPVVGRIAFWADDETCKVNINTAGEGAYWDWPKSATKDEMQLASNPPVQGEFERIAGHPATTSLSAILPELKPTGARSPWLTDTSQTFTTYNDAYRTSLGGILDMMPRLGGGNLVKDSVESGVTRHLTGSRGGTYPINYNQAYPPGSLTTFVFNDGGPLRPAFAYAPITINPNRLYTTADDFWFQPGSSTYTTSFRDSNKALSDYYGTDTTKMRQRLFFLTANSRAPETTLFETPRISLWPITWPYPSGYYYNAFTKAKYGIASKTNTQGTIRGGLDPVTSLPNPNLTTDTLLNLAAYKNPNGTRNITPQEQLLAFDSTLNKSAASPSYYFFQRQSSDSPIYDWSINRNRQLVNWLRYYLGKNTPAFGGNLANKWDSLSPNSTDWITLSIMDYTRSMVNQYTIDPNPDPAFPNNPGALRYSYTGVAASLMNFHQVDGTNPATGSPTERSAFTVTPLRILPNVTGGYTDTPNLKSTVPLVTSGGDFPSLKEVSVMFIASKRNAPTAPSLASDRPNPYKWSNLICYPADSANILNIPPPSGWSSPNRLMVGTVGATAANAAGRVYPANLQTTSMRAVMMFNFTGVRTIQSYGAGGPNFAQSFWVKVTGDSFRIKGVPINLPSAAPNATNCVQFSLNGPVGNPTAGAMFVPDNIVLKQGSTTSSNAYIGYTPKRFDNNPNTSLPASDRWVLISDEIPVNQGGNASPEFFVPFTGTKLMVSIYAPFPYDTTLGRNPDIDPTSPTQSATVDAQQLVAQYPVDFTKWSTGTDTHFQKGLPIPTAPRWNARQATSTVMPNANYFDPADTSGNKSLWMLSEMVPDTAANKSLSTTTATNTYIRNVTPFPASGLAWGTTGGNKTWDGMTVAASDDGTTANNSVSRTWMCYAYTAAPSSATPAGLRASPPTSRAVYVPPVGYTLPQDNWPIVGIGQPFCTQMENRLAAIYFDFVAEDSGCNLFSGDLAYDGGGDPYYNWNCPTLVTPYDTVIGVTTSLVQANGADPRLTLQGTVGPLTQSEYDKFVKNDGQNLYTNVPKNTGATADPMASTEILQPSDTITDNVIPRYTYQAQYHQLSYPATVPMNTGFQLQPKFLDRNAQTYSLLNTQGTYMGWTGATYATTWINGGGVETTPLMVLDSKWDWTSQSANNPDGGFIQRADQDYQSVKVGTGGEQPVDIPYFAKYGLAAVSAWGASGANNASTAGFFAPNRQIPSPIVLGTIPSSLTTGWQTLCFCPNPAQNMTVGAGTHPGPGVANSPSVGSKPYFQYLPDHLLLDFLWMPVAEPYPISEQFSTAGKVNLNYAMMPFPYVKRKTGMDAVLKSVWIYALSNATVQHTTIPSNPMSWDYKATQALTNDPTHSRFPVNVKATLQQFDNKFDGGDIFRSASQICDMFLYPADPVDPMTLSKAPVSGDGPGASTNITKWWQSMVLTSDNGREEPYNAIYSRVTTKSNTFTVHWKAQTLRKTPSTKSKWWVEGKDQVTSELRGSTLIERYLDPNANNIPEYATIDPSTYPPNNKTGPQPLTYYYKWRVASANYFQP